MALDNVQSEETPTTPPEISEEIQQKDNEKLTVAINRDVINKSTDFKTLTFKFKNRLLTLEELSSEINLGHAAVFCKMAEDQNGKTHRQASSFVESNTFAIDIDNSEKVRDEFGKVVKDKEGKPVIVRRYENYWPFDEALNDVFLKENALLLYKTPSSKPDWEKFRIVFKLPRVITSVDEYLDIVSAFIRRYGSDEACKDACRLFYGSRYSNPTCVGKTLKDEDVKTIVQHYCNDRIKTISTVNSKHQEVNAKEPETPAKDRDPNVISPCDDYNDRGNVIQLLESHGWVVVYILNGTYYLRRPGKSEGISATFNFPGENGKRNRFYCFTSSTEFKEREYYLPYAVFAMLEANNDYKEATKKLASLGYGKQQSEKKEDPQPTQATQSETTEITEIQLVGGELPEIVNKAETALMQHADPIYQRGGSLVRVIKTGSSKGVIKRQPGSLVVGEVSMEYLREQLTKAAKWLKFNSRTEEWQPVDCPEKIAKTYIARCEWKVPHLIGVTEIPILRENGTVFENAGYDFETGLLYAPAISFSKIKKDPTQDDAKQALTVLEGILSGFPFVDQIDKAVAISAIFTALVRPHLRTAPLHGFSAPKMGSGKSLLVDVVSLISTGRVVPVFNVPDSPEEEKKQFLSTLIEGDTVICIDNIERPFGSDSLCSILTQDLWKGRRLGSNVMVTVPTCATFLATGNNLSFKGDLSTRAIICNLDPRCERPEEREFKVDLRKYIPENRDSIVTSCLTALKAYIVNGSPTQNIKTYGRFEDWSRFVRSAIIWLGYEDPCKSRNTIEDSDPVRASLKQLLKNWYVAFNSEGKMIKEVLEVARQQNCDGLRASILEITDAKDIDSVSTKKLANLLKKFDKRVETIDISGVTTSVRLAKLEKGDYGYFWGVEKL